MGTLDKRGGTSAATEITAVIATRASAFLHILELAAALVESKTPRLPVLIFCNTSLWQSKARLLVIRPLGRGLTLLPSFTSAPGQRRAAWSDAGQAAEEQASGEAASEKAPQGACLTS